jgi:tryptophan halogenase
MSDNQIENIVIVGGGTAGWMAASALSTIMSRANINVTLVESEAIGTVGVGEATIPQIALFNELLGLDENEFMKRTQATFKLGIEFVDWGRKGESYIHPFGGYGLDMEGVHFHHFWLKAKKKNPDIPDLSDFNLQAMAARQNKFTRPLDVARSPLSKIHYAFQFDAGLYAKFLREVAEKAGTKRIEGRVTSIEQAPDSGHIQSVTLESGQTLQGDFFIDCTGFIGLLIEKTLKAGYEDWSKWLPVNRAVACACEQMDDPIPYTRATAKEAGWQWRIPLQHRLGNGYVYCDKFLSAEEAEAELMDSLEGEPLADPKHLHFVTGHRKKFWEKNCLSLGLAAGFMEPLESTSIHLIQTGLSRLMAQFPDKAFNQKDIDYYNLRTRQEYERVRDFLVLHYKATTRKDSPFWQHIQKMPLPDKLKQKMEIFEENGRIFREDLELFNETSWLAVMHGQGLKPKSYHPVVNVLSEDEIVSRLKEIHKSVVNSADYMPSHIDYIRGNCEANKENLSAKARERHASKTRRVNLGN